MTEYHRARLLPVLNTLLFAALSAAFADTLPPLPASALALQGGMSSVGTAEPSISIPIPVSPKRLARNSVDSMVLDKSDRMLTLFSQGHPVAGYRVALGTNPMGPKQRRGYGRTPEGLYYINGRNPESKYHLSLRIPYPSPEERRNAARRGISPGGDIMIHGLPRQFSTVGALHRQQDWTEGCVAVTNEEIEEIWRAVPNGAPILIQP
jgi:murein L,D-transpeptidase YafK